MSVEEALALIDDSKKFLEPYKMYGQMISDGIAQLDKLEKLVRDGAYGDAYKMCVAMCEQISTYKGFVPRLADNLDKIKGILETVR